MDACTVRSAVNSSINAQRYTMCSTRRHKRQQCAMKCWRIRVSKELYRDIRVTGTRSKCTMLQNVQLCIVIYNVIGTRYKMHNTTKCAACDSTNANNVL